MPAAFAALEQRVNAAVTARIGNALAIFEGGDEFPVVFDRAVASPLEGIVESAGPQAGFELAYTPGLEYQDTLTIDGVPYVVVGGLEPDSSGWVAVQLRLAS